MNATRYDETDLHHVGLVANKVFCILDCGPEQLVYTANSDTPYGPLLRDLSVGPLVVKLEPGPDGGILDPLPMAPIAAVNADLTIAVSLSGSEAGGRYEPTESEPRATTEWLNRMWRSTSSPLDTNAARSLLDTPSARAVLSRFDSAPEDMDDGDPEIKPESDEESVPRLGSFEVMNRTIDIAQAALARHTLAAYPPDLLIEVPRTACRSLEFHRAAEVIDIGHELAAQAIKALEA